MSDNTTACGPVEDNALIMAYVGLPLVCLVTSVSVLTIVTILHSPVLHETQYIFVLSLALTDILMAVTGAIGACGHLSWIRPHINTNMLETIIFGGSAGSVTVSGVHMSIIVIDRYIRIAHPFYYVQKITKRCILKILYCAWILWIVMACLPCVFSNVTNSWKCIYDEVPREYCLLVLALPVVSVIIVLVCYFKIALIAVRHKKAAIARRHQNEENRDTTVFGSNNIVMKSIKFFVTMSGVYFVCAVVPFTVLSIASMSDITHVARFTLFYLFHAHSVLNFFICCGMDKRFFRALKLTFRGQRFSCCLCRHMDQT